MKEEVIEIDVKDIKNFPNHPFKITNNLNYEELRNSIIESGVLVPTIVRKSDDGKYEMLSGHRRKKICEEQGIKKIPCIVKDISDEEAVVLMVDSNLQREKILPSEKAMAYKMKYDAFKKQGKTLFPSGTDSELNDTKTQVYRYIRLNYLIPELLQLVDDTVLKDKRTALTMGLRPAVELSYLNQKEQEMVYEEIYYDELTPSHYQAKKMRKLSEQGKLNADEIENILWEEKGNQKEQISSNKEKIEKALPSELLRRDKRYIEQYILKAIDYYKSAEIERGDNYDIEL